MTEWEYREYSMPILVPEEDWLELSITQYLEDCVSKQKGYLAYYNQYGMWHEELFQIKPTRWERFKASILTSGD